MPKARVGELEIAYTTSGDPGAVPILLIMGLGAQLIAWDDAFVDELVRRGHYVVRFDNRDVGESTHLSHLPKPNVLASMMALMSGQAVQVAYRLEDMAGDAIGLLDALGLDSAHVVGASMGGMIAQVMALRAPERVRSLTSIMSSTNDRDLPPGDPAAMQTLMSLSSSEAPASVETAVTAFRTIASPGYPFEEARVRRTATLSRQRGYEPAGVARQLLAVVSTPGRREALGALRVPTLVIHGDKDPLVPLAAGQATAAAIPGARLWVVPGMGHDLPTPLMTPVADAISTHATAAEAQRARGAAS